ncbi:globin CTT-W-like [Ruditapes philippinarum]|uniref:globin CTT-W-like n=1 Tax=Ruditapes philippinarum TaxID=129788 RepID=UPI00295BFC5E|nr:globin CTT-W-like [Ruditapes philippinarum]
MFKSKPELIRTFSTFEGKDVNKLQESGLLQQHAVRVMSTIDKCIIHINDPSSMEYILQEVGEHHNMYNVRSNDIQIILPHFLTAMKPYSQDPWCEELQDVWTRFLSLIVYHIKKAMQRHDNDNSLEFEDKHVNTNEQIENR